MMRTTVPIGSRSHLFPSIISCSLHWWTNKHMWEEISSCVFDIFNCRHLFSSKFSFDLFSNPFFTKFPRRSTVRHLQKDFFSWNRFSFVAMPPPRSRSSKSKSKSKYFNVDFVKEILFDPNRSTFVIVVLFVVEIFLNLFIIRKINYTEIDWIAYMQEVEGVVNGTFDYSELKGDTGPLV